MIAINLPAIARYLGKWALFIALYAALVLFVIFMGRFKDASWDIAVLLACNPDHYVPGIDQLMIFMTDFSTYLFSITAVSWQVAYLIARESPRRKAIVANLLWVEGAVFFVYHLCGLFVSDVWGFHWLQHEYRAVFFLLAALSGLLLFLAGFSFKRLNDDSLRMISGTFWLVILSVLFTNSLYGEGFIKQVVQRPRPLNDFYAAWNGQIRTIPDEIVRGSFSYVSGHSSSLFALLTPIIWAVRNRWLKAGLFAYAALHAFTRVYVAAHFPYCCIMGSFLGFTIGSMIFLLFWRYGTSRIPGVIERK